MSSPVEARISAVFVPVRSMERSIEWYSKILGLPTPDDYSGETHLFRLRGGVGVFLQRTERVEPSPHVLFSLPAADIDAAYAFMQENEIEVVAITQDLDGSTLQFRDPDGHLLMAGDIW